MTETAQESSDLKSETGQQNTSPVTAQATKTSSDHKNSVKEETPISDCHTAGHRENAICKENSDKPEDIEFRKRRGFKLVKEIQSTHSWENRIGASAQIAPDTNSGREGSAKPKEASKTETVTHKESNKFTAIVAVKCNSDLESGQDDNDHGNTVTDHDSQNHSHSLCLDSTKAQGRQQTNSCDIPLHFQTKKSNHTQSKGLTYKHQSITPTVDKDPKPCHGVFRTTIKDLLSSWKVNRFLSDIEDCASNVNLGKSVSDIATGLSAKVDCLRNLKGLEFQLAKAYTIFVWICKHIDYDYKLLQLKRSGCNIHNMMSVDHIISTKATICSGYSKLFNALANEVGIDTIIIDGHSKSLPEIRKFYQPFSCNKDNSHSWNAVSYFQVYHIV